MSDSSRNFVPVAIWELERVIKRKDFLVSVLLIPLFALGLGGAITWFKLRAEKDVHKVAVAWQGTGESQATLDSLKGFQWIVPAPDQSTPDALARAVKGKTYAAALILPADFAETGRAKLVVRREAPKWKIRIEQHLLEQARVMRAARIGITRESLARLGAPVTLDTEQVLPRPKVSTADRILGIMLLMLMLTSIMVIASYMSIGIAGEKQARVTEVILSAVHPQTWTDGKIVAYTLIGILQGAIWAVSLLAVTVFMSWSLPTNLNLGFIALLLAFSLLGFVFYASTYALIFATIKDMYSTQKFQAYLFFLPFIPLFFMDPLIENPEAPWVIAVGVLPLFSTVMMPTKIALSGAATWEIVLALVLLAGAAWMMRSAAGHALRIGMLMYGKELSFPELVRWARTP